MSMVNITIDGKPVQVPAGTTVLEAAKQVGIDIPTLCYLKDVNAIGACRMCLVEIKGAKALQAACVYPVAEGNEILTASPTVKEARRVNLELLLSNHKEWARVSTDSPGGQEQMNSFPRSDIRPT